MTGPAGGGGGKSTGPHPLAPCATCPYRRDVPTYHWAKAEFVGVLANEVDPIGKVYSCHKHADLDPKDRGMCAGWLLDQRKRNLPCIALRIVLSTVDHALAALDAVTDGGFPLYSTVKQMCRANGVRAISRRIADAPSRTTSRVRRTRRPA